MRSAAETPAAGPIASAVAASSLGLKKQDLDLESSLTEASLFARLAYNAFCNVGFENLDPPTLDREDNELVYWTISRLNLMIDEAKAAFYEEHERKAAAS